MNSLDKITIQGFKSIKELEDFELKKLNIIIGANGSGKSNLISFFYMLRSFIDGNLNRFVRDNGGAGDVLFKGRKATERIKIETFFGDRGFRFNLVPTPKDEFAVEDEARYYKQSETGWWALGDSNDGTSKLTAEVKNSLPGAKYSIPVYNSICSWQIYHFNDTSGSAAMRYSEIIQDNAYLRPSAQNIAPFLLELKENNTSDYREIVNAVKSVAPFFDDFILKPQKRGGKEKVNLSWRQKGTDFPMQPYHFSDGTLRFVCLATALLQPELPSTIIIDEPELGLHPEAIAVLAELIKTASKRTQVIAATQSPTFVNYFSIEDIIVVNRKNGQSVFNRMNREDFSVWLEDYSVGELWEQNVINGGTHYE